MKLLIKQLKTRPFWLATALSLVAGQLCLASAVFANPEPRDVNVISPNRHVEPGAVHWKGQLSDASAASAKSGKPVLLFVMLGNLDQEFC